jgi:hypothetical protein
MALDEGGNYISQVATPEIMQQAALQGLEGGGYVPEAIGKATAGIALPFLQGLPAASATLTEAPARVRALNANTASSLLPLADYQGGLNRADYARQQSVALAGLTEQPATLQLLWSGVGSGVERRSIMANFLNDPVFGTAAKPAVPGQPVYDETGFGGMSPGTAAQPAIGSQMTWGQFLSALWGGGGQRQQADPTGSQLVPMSSSQQNPLWGMAQPTPPPQKQQQSDSTAAVMSLMKMIPIV